MNDDSTPGAVALLALGSFGYAAMMFSWFSLPAYLPVVSADLGISEAKAGALAGAVPLTYVPVALFSGLLTDRLGARRTVGAGLLVIGLAHLVRGYASGFVPMLAATALLGVGGTGITFGLPKLVSGLFAADRVGAANTVYLLGSSAGTASAFAIGRPLLGPALGGWRPLFRATGAAVLAVGLAWIVAARLLARSEVAETESERPLAALGTVVRSRGMQLLVVVGFAYLLTMHGLQGMLQTVLEARGWSAVRAGRTNTLLVVAQVVGLLTVPVFADRYDRRRSATVASASLCTAGTAALAAGGPAFAAVALVGLGAGGLSPLVRALPVELDDVGPERTGVAVGLVFAVGEAGGFVGPFAIGALQELTGSYAPGLALLSVGGAAAVLASAAMDV